MHCLTGQRQTLVGLAEATLAVTVDLPHSRLRLTWPFRTEMLGMVLGRLRKILAKRSFMVPKLEMLLIFYI